MSEIEAPQRDVRHDEYAQFGSTGIILDMVSQVFTVIIHVLMDRFIISNASFAYPRSSFSVYPPF